MEKKDTFPIYKTLPVFMAFYVMGFGDIIGVATSYTQLEFGLTNTTTQILTFMVFVWFALLSVPVGVFQDKKGKKFTIISGISFIAMSMIIPVVAYNYYGMLISFTLLGLGSTIMQVPANPLMRDVSSPDKLSRNLTLSQFIKAIAGMAGPFIVAFCAVQFTNWRLVYWIYFILCLISIIWLYITPIREQGNKGNAHISGTLKLLVDKKVALLVGGTFVVVGFDIGLNTNIINYLKERFGASQEEGSIGISIYFAALMTGRLLSAIILNRMKGNRFLLYCALLSFAAFLMLYFMPNLLTGQIAIFFVGLFTAAIFPLIFSTGLQYMPDHANELSGLIIMSVCGGGIIPPLVGVLNDYAGLMTALSLLGICLLYIVFLAVYINKMQF